ncbi:helix-turn-helix transcriptional regulator [Collinsella provencensis]|uniref:helix-turn-helix transcriptional regulator n=1 Tax=Collinsella provencensis TaxID=1937461 RepID=UPI001F2C18ED|nr:LuxR C-terminal-related transcriptional regulator [Collinsella provencensis]
MERLVDIIALFTGCVFVLAGTDGDGLGAGMGAAASGGNALVDGSAVLIGNGGTALIDSGEGVAQTQAVFALPSASVIAALLLAIIAIALFETLKGRKRLIPLFAFCAIAPFLNGGMAFLPLFAYEAMRGFHGSYLDRSGLIAVVLAYAASLYVCNGPMGAAGTTAHVSAVENAMIGMLLAGAALLAARTNRLYAQRELSRRVRDDMQERALALRGENEQLTDAIHELQSEHPTRDTAGNYSTRPTAFACLTEREYEVARLVADGLDNHEIAAVAYISEGTVRNRISSILSKMGLKNRTQIAVAWWRG